MIFSKVPPKVSSPADLLSDVHSLYEKYFVDMILLTICETGGLCVYGTGKFDYLMTVLGTMFKERAYDVNFYADTKHLTTCNDFRYTDMHNEIEIIKDRALNLAKFSGTHVLVIVTNSSGKKFIIVSDKLKRRIATTELSELMESAQLKAELDDDADK